MIHLELFVARGTFGAVERRRLAERLTMKELLTHVDAVRHVLDANQAASANAGVMDFLESINHVIVHEIGTWIVNGQPRGPEEPPRYLVRAYVPGPWRKSLSAFLIATITRALSQSEAEPGSFYREPRVEVQVIGVPEGGYGVFGRVVGEADLLDMISEAKSDPPAIDPGVLIDPVCGMVATGMVATLEHDGTTYGFCSPGCRRHFAKRLAEGASR